MILVLFFQNLYSIWRKLLDKYRAATVHDTCFFFLKKLEINISKLHIGITCPLYCIYTALFPQKSLQEMHEMAACLACLMNPHVGLPGGDERQVDLRRPGSHFSRVTRRTGVERLPPSTCFSNAKLLQSHSSSILQSLNFFEVKWYFAFQISLKIKVQVSW